jgi:hypothetical protein
MTLPDDYLKAVADAVHAVGGLFVLELYCLWCDVGGHASHRRGCADFRSTKMLEQLALLRHGDDE